MKRSEVDIAFIRVRMKVVHGNSSEVTYLNITEVGFRLNAYNLAKCGWIWMKLVTKCRECLDGI